jgi:phenylalanyl-tRNA synthetase alpha chain
MAAIQDSHDHGYLTTQILQSLEKHEFLLSAEAFPIQKSTDVKSSLDRLASRLMVTYETIEREEPVLEAEGEEITANGSHEARVFEALQGKMAGLTIQELESAVGDRNVVKVGQSRAFKAKWIVKGKDGRFVANVRLVDVCNRSILKTIIADEIDQGRNQTAVTDNPRYESIS